MSAYRRSSPQKLPHDADIHRHAGECGKNHVSSALLQFLVVLLGHPGRLCVRIQHDFTAKHDVVVDCDTVILHETKPGAGTANDKKCAPVTSGRTYAVPLVQRHWNRYLEPTEYLEAEGLIDLNTLPNFGAQCTIDVREHLSIREHFAGFLPPGALQAKHYTHVIETDQTVVANLRFPP